MTSFDVAKGFSKASVSAADASPSGGPSPSPSPAPPPPASPPPEFFQAAVANAGIPVISLSPSGTVSFWNLAAARLFARPDNIVLNKPFDLLIPAEFRSTASHALQRTLQQRGVNMYEMAFVPPGGKTPVHVGVTLSCVLDANNQCIGIMAWLRNITIRKELETNLQRTRHMASLGTLAAGVAHHFNNIVCGMNTMVEMAISTEDPAAMSRALKMSAEAASRIGYITQSLLAFTHHDECEVDYADLTEELLRFADAVEPTLKNKGIELDLDLQAKRVAAIPRHRFSQALQHLLQNAEESFGEVADKSRPRRITIRTMSQDDQIMLQFSDNGHGIPAEGLAQIFDPFYTTKGVQGGGCKSNPGLGLTLVHGVVIDMGGHIWADSVDGQGATINMLIPIVV